MFAIPRFARRPCSLPLVLAALLSSLTLSPSATNAQEPGASEADAAQAAVALLARGPMAEALSAEERAAVAEATLRPLPQLEVSHEQVFGDTPEGYLELTLGLSRTWDIADWRGALLRASREREKAVEVGLDIEARQRAHEAREAFWQVRASEERLAILTRWQTRAERGLQNVEGRERGQDASRLDVLRIAGALAEVRAEVARERQTLARARAALHGQTGWPHDRALAGEIAPDAVSEGLAKPLKSTDQLPQLAQFEVLEQALVAESGAWGKPWLRDWTVSGAYRLARGQEATGHGVALALSVPLALENPDEARLAHLAAQRARLRAERERLNQELTRAQQAAHARLAAAQLAHQAPAQGPPAGELTELMQAAFEAGEATLADLMDTWRQEAALGLARVEADLELREAFLESLRYSAP